MADCFQTARRILFTAFLLGAATAQGGTILFQDNFNQQGTTLNSSNWTADGGGTIGRTELSPWNNNGGGQFVVGSTGAQLSVSTYNPSDPGDTLLGTQANTIEDFQPSSNNDQIVLTASLQLNSVQQGLVYGMYLYGANDVDEIDIELVTNYMQAGAPMQVELNRFSAGSPDTGDGGLVNLPVGFNPLALNTWTIVWSPTEIDYYVDGTLLSTATSRIPDSPMSANVIGFAPNTNWGAAYYGGLQPATSAGQNQTFTALLTNLTVTDVATPEPGTWVLTVLGLVAMLWFGAVRTRRA